MSAAQTLRKARALRLGLEELAANPSWEEKSPNYDGPIVSGAAPDEVQTSIALSLKRIADLLDGSALGLCVTETIFNPQTVQNHDVRTNF